jgi:hypothetical protein
MFWLESSCAGAQISRDDLCPCFVAALMGLLCLLKVLK